MKGYHGHIMYVGLQRALYKCKELGWVKWNGS